MAKKRFRDNMAGKESWHQYTGQHQAGRALLILDKLFTAKHRTTKSDLAGLVSASATMYALLLLVACDGCGFTSDTGVLTALVAGTFAFSTPYYVRIVLGKRGKQDSQDKDTADPVEDTTG